MRDLPFYMKELEAIITDHDKRMKGILLNSKINQIIMMLGCVTANMYTVSLV